MAREVASIMIHCGWEPIPEKGDPAVNVVVTPPVIVAHNGLILPTEIFTDLYVGGELAHLNSITPLMSSQHSKTDPETGLYWSYLFKDGRIGYRVLSTGLKKDFTAASYVLYDGKQYPFEIQFVNVSDGPQGLPGRDRKPPRTREWGAVPVGDTLTTGLNETDDWTDVVYIRDEEAPAGAWYWQCIKDFTKQKGQIPPDNNSDTGNDLYGYLRKTSNYAALATDLFFATFALIKNLGVETIDMRDGSGNILFQAKDGVVTCNTGNFRNIHISGNSTFRGFVFHEKTEITAANYASMSITKTYAPGYSRTELDLMKTGNWIEIKSLPATDTFHYTSLPAIRTGEAYTDAYRDYVRQFMGNEIMIYNTSGKSIAIDTGESSVEIRHENACYFRMVMAPETSKNSSIKLERIKWEYTGPFQY